MLDDVLGTDISPELVPTGEDEEIQSTEATGPYAMQDFNLFHSLRYGARPDRIAFLAWHAWHDERTGSWPPSFPDDDRPSYTIGEIAHWLDVFVQRFFGFSQFKWSALPNGPKVVAGGRSRREVTGGRHRTCRRQCGGQPSASGSHRTLDRVTRPRSAGPPFPRHDGTARVLT